MNLFKIPAIYHAGERYDGSWISAHGISCWFIMHVSLHLYVDYYLLGQLLESQFRPFSGIFFC